MTQAHVRVDIETKAMLDELSKKTGLSIPKLLHRAMEIINPPELICPFCGQGTIDKVGLKWHLIGGDNCNEFEETYLLHS